jgi:acetyltransferase-like isoleucine patch superfamily enzyme
LPDASHEPHAARTTISSAISSRSLFEIARGQLWSLLRGLSWKLRRRRISAQLFVRRGVSIDDYAIIDALSCEGIQVGDATTLAKFSYLKCSSTLGNLGVGIVIGDHTAIGAYSYVGAAGGVIIGDNVLFGQRVSIHAENHKFDRLDIPVREQGVSHAGVRIEDDCWIGSHSVVLDGITIGRGAIVVAGSVVSRDIPPGAVVSGVPARLMRMRGEEKPGT